MALHATLSDSALAQPQMAQWAQLLPYRCSHYSSSLTPCAARQSQPCWWCTPFLQVQTGISQESLLTQFPWSSPAPPWSMISNSDPQIHHSSWPGERALLSRQKKKDPERRGEESQGLQDEIMHTQSLTVLYCNSKLPQSVLVGIPQSADEIQWVSEWVSEVEQRARDGGGWRMLCELCCSFNQCWASLQRCASVSLTNSLLLLSPLCTFLNFFLSSFFSFPHLHNLTELN